MTLGFEPILLVMDKLFLQARNFKNKQRAHINEKSKLKKILDIKKQSRLGSYFESCRRAHLSTFPRKFPKRFPKTFPAKKSQEIF